MLVANHGPFTWGPDASRRSSTRACSSTSRGWSGASRTMAPDAPRRRTRFLVDKHYLRKHGPKALLRAEMTRRGPVGPRRDARRLRGLSLAVLARHDARPRASRSPTSSSSTASARRTTASSRLARRRRPAERVQRVGDAKEQLYRDLARRGARAAAGRLSVGTRLRHAGWRQAIASSAPRANVDVMRGRSASRAASTPSSPRKTSRLGNLTRRYSSRPPQDWEWLLIAALSSRTRLPASSRRSVPGCGLLE